MKSDIMVRRVCRLLTMSHQIIRDGGWGNPPSCPRTAYRQPHEPGARLDRVGFRGMAEALQSRLT